MIEVTVARLGLDSTTNSYVVILREKEGSRLLPIWIGQTEAESIVNAMNHVAPPRPNAHDLIARLVRGMGGALRRVTITRVENNTYFAELALDVAHIAVQIDARPSDSIAVALRLGTPIFVPDELLSDFPSSHDAPDGNAPSTRDQELSVEQLKAYLERLRPEDFGKFNP